ncbi:MAG: NAD(P)-dependent oxidoreductase [Crocosphaera sp.]|nr:NAD(P)-dependent oxidoreductase [Crocosphaera sp.]
MSKIAILGTGAMGSRMGENLIKAKHEVFVYNRTAERSQNLVDQGAILVNSPREAAQKAEIVMSMVTDTAASEAVWLDPNTGALEGLHSGSIAIESSTLTPTFVKELGDKIIEKGAEFLDAPVVGTRPQAEQAKLVYLVGGTETALSKVHDILAVMGGLIHHIGPMGSGTVMKLAVNSSFGIQIAAIAEILNFLSKSGIEIEKAVDILGGLPITSPTQKMMMGHIKQRLFSPLFPIDLVEKDFRYMVESSDTVGVSVPTISAVWKVYLDAKEQGYGGDNITGVAQLFD